MKKIIYLDNAAATKPYPIAVKKLIEISENIYGNPSSLHKLGLQAEKELNSAKEKISGTILNAYKDDFIFTSGGTESNNLIIKGTVYNRTSKHLITTQIEHPSVLNVYKSLEKDGFEIKYLAVDNNGLIDIDVLKSVIRKDTSLISIIHTNNETGAVQNIDVIGRIIKECNPATLFHIDAVQSYGKMILNPAQCFADLISISGHKIHGVKGAGVIFIKKNLKLKSLFNGGNQEYGFRAGTENVGAVSALGVAAEKIYEEYNDKYNEIKEMYLWFINELQNDFKDIIINSPYMMDGYYSPFILNISFPYLKGEVILHSLEEEGIYVSTGSACHSKTNSVSYVLKSISVPKKYIEGSLRFGLSYSTTKDELKTVLTHLKKIVKELTLLFPKKD